MLDLPADYTPSRLFAGFQNEALGVSLVILELPGKAFDEVAGGFTNEALAARGITGAERASLARAGEHIFVRAKQTSPAGAYEKLFVLFREGDLTVLVSANVPARALEDGAVKRETIEAALASARISAVVVREDLFSLGYLGPFKEAGSLLGTAKIFTLDGKMSAPPEAGPRSALIVAPALDQREVGDARGLARSLLQTLTGYTLLNAGEARGIEIDGLPAVEIEGEGRDAATQRVVRLHQTLVLPKSGGYIRLVGIGAEADGSVGAGEFAKIAASLKMKAAR